MWDKQSNLFWLWRWVMALLVLTTCLERAGSCWTKELYWVFLRISEISKSKEEPWTCLQCGFITVSPLPSRVFHPPSGLQQLIHKSGVLQSNCTASDCSPRGAETETSLLLCQHRAAKMLFPANYCMPQMKRGLKASLRGCGVGGQKCNGERLTMERKAHRDIRKERRGQDEKVEVRKGKTAYEEEKYIVEKSGNLWLLHGFMFKWIGT